MHKPVEINVVDTSVDQSSLDSISKRLSNLEKSNADQNNYLKTLQDASEEISKRISVLHESVTSKEKIMEARARICNDRVFLIEAAAGRKDDVFNAIETLFQNSQRTSERLTSLERSLANVQGHVVDTSGSKDSSAFSQDEVPIKYSNQLTDPSRLLPKERRHASTPPSQIFKHICDEMYGNISLPGVRFVGQGRNWLHRYLWVILHLTTFSISFNYIKESYDTWQDSPVVLSLNNSLTRPNLT